MNSCILMARIVQAPERRMTPDGNAVLSSMLVEFTGGRETDPPHRLKAVGWGNLAEDIHQNYQVGDWVILQGSLRMNTIDRPEGFKEKRAELNISRIYRQTPGMSFAANDAAPADYSRTDNVVPMESYNRAPTPEPVPAPTPPSSAPAPLSEDDLDNIPF
ncbi:MAG: single-stranded DNA-binding protein [Cyanobacteria bacterium P01_G01_bin.54]